MKTKPSTNQLIETKFNGVVEGACASHFTMALCLRDDDGALERQRRSYLHGASPANVVTREPPPSPEKSHYLAGLTPLARGKKFPGLNVVAALCGTNYI